MNIIGRKSLAIMLTATMVVSMSACGEEKSSMTNENQMTKLASEMTVSEVPEYNNTYEIFVGSFCDSDGDGVGDLQGIISKLDYLNDGDDSTDTDLGVNALWLTPVCPSPTYHKYDVTDYMDIDEEFGTLEDYKELVEEAHARGIKVIFDTVFNHTSSEHPWFTAAVEYLQNLPEGQEPSAEECPYIEYYNFTTESGDGYSEVEGTDYYYEARFYYGMPDLNLNSDAVRSELSDILAFWQDLGVDGFRLDAALYYYTGQNDKNIEFLSWVNDTAKANNPDVYVVAEAWTNFKTYVSYYESGIDSLFDFAFADQTGLIAQTARGTMEPSELVENMVKEEARFSEEAPGEYLNAPFYTNHDLARGAGYYAGEDRESMIKMAQGLNMLMSGNVYLYYGEELGQKGNGDDENKRGPFRWVSLERDQEDSASDGGAGSTASDSASDSTSVSTASDTTGMCDGPENMDTSKESAPFGSLADQQNDGGSIYTYVKCALRMRNAYPVIGRGSTVALSGLSEEGVAGLLKESDAYENVCILMNTSAEAKTVDLSADSGADGYRVLSGVLLADSAGDSDASGDSDGSGDSGATEASVSGDTVTLPAYSIVLLTAGE